MTSLIKSTQYAQSWMVFFDITTSDGWNTVSRQGPPYPGAADGGLHVIGPIPVYDKLAATGDDSGHRLRGVMPGLYQLLHNSSFLPINQFSSAIVSSGLSGRTVLIAPVGGSTNNNWHGGVIALDVTGPWR